MNFTETIGMHTHRIRGILKMNLTRGKEGRGVKYMKEP
jgi:hypothetical protein